MDLVQCSAAFNNVFNQKPTPQVTLEGRRKYKELGLEADSLVNVTNHYRK